MRQFQRMMWLLAGLAVYDIILRPVITQTMARRPAGQ